MNRSEYLVEIRYQESDLARFIIGIQVLLSLLALIVTPMTMAAVLKSTLHVNARILLTRSEERKISSLEEFGSEVSDRSVSCWKNQCNIESDFSMSSLPNSFFTKFKTVLGDLIAKLSVRIAFSDGPEITQQESDFAGKEGRRCRQKIGSDKPTGKRKEHRQEAIWASKDFGDKALLSLPIVLLLAITISLGGRDAYLGSESVFDIAGIACASGTLLIALERTIATFLYRTYETKSHAWIGYLLMSIPVLCMTSPGFHELAWDEAAKLSNFKTPDSPMPEFKRTDKHMYEEDRWFLGSSVWVLNLTTTEEESLVNTCDLQPAPMNELILCTFLTTQIITLLLFTIICILNRRKLTRQEGIYQRLAAIYQLKENINTTALMLPIALINAALYAVHVVAIAFFDRLFSEALSVSETNLLIVRARLVHYAYLLKSTTAIFALCISFIVVRQNYSIRKIIFKWLHMKTRINVVEPSPLDGGYVYFRALQEQWALAAR
ncbi:unnamed protein product [Toxocara canis]|uniref:Phosphodiesterase n=1 Tax=Toxocara canis TaxID=6265 RepID=A0A183UF60_TOXCA|nr:unnamed protein product [Toxocara canis]